MTSKARERLTSYGATGPKYEKAQQRSQAGLAVISRKSEDTIEDLP